MSNINYEKKKRKLQGRPVSVRCEDAKTRIPASGTIVIYAMNGKMFFQTRNLSKKDAIILLRDAVNELR